MPYRKWLRRLGWILVLGLALSVVAIAVIIGPLGGAIHDAEHHVVRLGWDDDAHRLLINEPIREPLAQDGPYVRRLSDAYELMRIDRVDGRWQARTQRLPLTPRPVIEVAVDNPARTRFLVPLRAPAKPLPAESPMPARLLLASDLEGGFDQFVALMQAQGVIDARLHWSYGTGHLVLAGDMVDRGHNVLPLLWLVYRMEGEAAQAGGRVHYVLGNHELRNLYGSFKDVPVRMFASRDAFFGGDNRRLFGADTVLGQWLRAHHVIERIGDVLVVHGGVSQAFLARRHSIEAANAIARRELDVPDGELSERAQPVLGEFGPPWYRGMARAEKAIEDDRAAHLDAVLAYYGARRIAVGHSLVRHVSAEQGGKLLRLDVAHARQLPEAMLLERGRVYRVDAAGGRARLQ